MNCIICNSELNFKSSNDSSPIIESECCDLFYREFGNEQSIVKYVNEDYSCDYWSKDNMTEVWLRDSKTSDFNNWKVIAEIEGNKLLYLTNEKLLDMLKKMTCLL